MVTETDTKTVEQVCKMCGVEVRPGSQFCFGCGTAISPAVSERAREHDTDSGPAIPRPDFSPEASVPESRKRTQEEKDALESSRTATYKSGRTRRTAGPVRKKRVKRFDQEIAWVEPEGPGWGFIVASALVIVIAGLLILAAMLLR